MVDKSLTYSLPRGLSRPLIKSSVNRLAKTLAEIFPVTMTDAPISATLVSRWGLAGAADVGAISIANGEYQIGTAAWTSDAGTVAEKDKVRVRLTTSAEYETAVVLTLTCDTEEYVWSATTLADPAPEAADRVTVGGEYVVVDGEYITIGAE
jgi:hypothetical protein